LGNIVGIGKGRFTLFKILNSNDVKKFRIKKLIDIVIRIKPIILKLCGINFEFIINYRFSFFLIILPIKNITPTEIKPILLYGLGMSIVKYKM
jgi:hypothetical protein